MVYFARLGQTNMIKIGYTDDIKTRILLLRHYYNLPIHVLCVTPGRKTMEKEIHKRFARYRVCIPGRKLRELFYDDHEIIDFIRVLPNIPKHEWPNLVRTELDSDLIMKGKAIAEDKDVSISEYLSNIVRQLICS